MNNETRIIKGIISKIITPPNKMYTTLYLTSYDESGRFTLQNNKSLLNNIFVGDSVTINYKIALRNNYNDLIITKIEKRYNDSVPSNL